MVAAEFEGISDRLARHQLVYKSLWRASVGNEIHALVDYMALTPDEWRDKQSGEL